MTIKTIYKTSNISIEENKKSDMQKRGAVRNLFNTTVDRDELQRLSDQAEKESYKILQNYKCDSIIGVIPSASLDQARKHKRLPRCLESDSDDSDQAQKIIVKRETSCSDEASSSGDQQPSRSSTSKIPDLKLIATSALPKGQKTLKEYFPTVKRKRHN